MANEGLGSTDTILTLTDLAETYTAGQTTTLDSRGAQHLALYINWSAGDATDIRLRVRTKRSSADSFVADRFADKVLSPQSQGTFRVAVLNLDRDENEVEVALRRNGGSATGNDATVKARFSRANQPALTTSS